ncbi:hypothetical protein SynA15127_01116 [Synechococcus sp. A15-127]|uniref:DUF1824 family protein n=1 Tax=Synechococcus sp. A15-127 TaxID=1050624 RepID=UPI0016484089|nr:DUF1824 family protein [Synechococcus sp. A15-127]QNI94197.1 hypothetical protein SynA15127_01116 [Synechococcus sp. A15-127]
MSDRGITQLSDLARLRGAPELSPASADRLRAELANALSQSSWFTVGVMAPSAEMALKTLRTLESSQGWDPLDLVETTEESGPAYLKANQKVGTIRIRIEHGLGEGVLISGHGDDETQPSTTWGPLPLDFF